MSEVSTRMTAMVATVMIAMVITVGAVLWMVAGPDGGVSMTCYQNVAFATSRNGLARVPDWDWRCH